MLFAQDAGRDAELSRIVSFLPIAPVRHHNEPG